MVDLIKVASGANDPDFEGIKKRREDGTEFWLERELFPLLGYSSWQRFFTVVERAKQACKSIKINTDDHFNHIVKKVILGSKADRDIEDVELSRFACYLIVQNGDPSKAVIAAGQAYFAIQTRRQELSDEERFERLSDDEKRLYLRRELTEHNKSLAAAARDAGVETSADYAVFQNYGYKGLYGGLGAKEIHARKKLKKSHHILDYMGHEELAANLFRATQTDAKLRRDKVQGKDNANRTHLVVGQAVRKTIRDLGGTMPEDLPVPEKSIKKIEREVAKAAQMLENEKK